MKNFFCKGFLLFSFFCSEVSAQDDTRREDVTQGIIKSIISKKSSTETFTDESLFAFNPKFSNWVVSDLRLEDNYQSTDRKDEFKDTEFEGRLYSRLNINNNLSFNGYFKLKHFDKASEIAKRDSLSQGGGDRTFEDEGLYAEELNLAYDNGKYAIVAGKFDLNLGTAWRWDRGIWSYDLAENYQQSEKLGIDGIYRLGNAKTVGEYNFGFGIFKNDRKNLDNSIITKRDSVSKSDAIAGDTGFLKSYVVSLDVNYDFGEREKLSYHFAYMDAAVNERVTSVSKTQIDSQKDFVAAMNYKYPVSENFDIDYLIEYVNIKNLNGNSFIGENYLTTNIINKFYEKWLVTLGYSERDQSQVDAAGFYQNLSEISFGYEFGKTLFFDRLILQAGYKNVRNDYKTSLETQNVIGGLLRLYKNF